MGFGSNLQFLRKMYDGMTQERLAEKIGVSRQTISKWEMELSFPEMEKAISLCNLFNCSLDELLRGNVNTDDDAYTNLRIETINSFHYFMYAVISENPEKDAKDHVHNWAVANHIKDSKIIGWNFPFVSQEQVNVYHMHGYAAACMLQEKFESNLPGIGFQNTYRYAVITIRDPFRNPFVLIPNAYRTLSRYMEVNQFHCIEDHKALSCFEWEYKIGEVIHMDIYLAIEA
ncbi:MAG: helix-turn-helix transcriptional regulator [Lachnospiraceae bacterium]